MTVVLHFEERMGPVFPPVLDQNPCTPTFNESINASNDGKATTSYTYNGTDAAGKAEYRGLVTATTVSGLVGASSGFTAGYDPDAALTLEGHPNGMRSRARDVAQVPPTATVSGLEVCHQH